MHACSFMYMAGFFDNASDNYIWVIIELGRLALCIECCGGDEFVGCLDLFSLTHASYSPSFPHTHTHTHTLTILQAWFTYRQTGMRRSAWPPIKASYSPRHTNADSLHPDHLKHSPYSPQSSGESSPPHPPPSRLAPKFDHPPAPPRIFLITPLPIS